MKVQTSRVPTAVLRPIVEGAIRDLDRIDQTLSALLVVLTASDRKTIPRTRTGFPAAARVLANLLQTRPEIGAAADYQGDAVLEDLDNVELVEPLLPRLQALIQRIEDSRLLWLAEAQEPTLAAYGVARVRAERDGTLAPMIEPLKKLLANGPSARGSADVEEAPAERADETTSDLI